MTNLWPLDPSVTWPDAASLAAATEAYARSWWRWNPGVLVECAANPVLRGRLIDAAADDGIVTTADVYRDLGSDAWSSARESVQLRAAAACQVGELRSRERPCAHVTIGCSGSGKTTVLRRLAHAHRKLEYGQSGGVVIVDADRVRQILPEYAEGRGHQVVGDECYSVTYELVLPPALENRHDLVFDTLGKMEARVLVECMIETGYDVHLLLAEAPEDVCLERVRDRALRDGRAVPDGLVSDVQPLARDTFESLIGQNPPLAGWAVVDTATPTGHPALLQSGGRWTDVGNEVLQVAQASQT